MSPNKPKTPHRTIRVSDDLWLAAQAIADERGDNLSAVIRAALERYVRTHRRQAATTTEVSGE